MTEDYKKICALLLELKNISKKSNPNNIVSIMKTYNLLFLGENFNTIYSNELFCYLKRNLNVELTEKRFNELIPDICKSLNIIAEPMIKVDDLKFNNPPIYCYTLTLW